MVKRPIRISIVEDDFTDALERYKPIIIDDREVRLFFDACHAGDFHKDPYERLGYEGRQALFRVGFKDVIPFAGGGESMHKLHEYATDFYLIDEMKGEGFAYAHFCGKDKSYVLVGKDSVSDAYSFFYIPKESDPTKIDFKKMAQEQGFKMIDISIEGALERFLRELN